MSASRKAEKDRFCREWDEVTATTAEGDFTARSQCGWPLPCPRHGEEPRKNDDKETAMDDRNMSHGEVIEQTITSALTAPSDSVFDTLIEGDFGDVRDWPLWRREAFAKAAALALTGGSA